MTQQTITRAELIEALVEETNKGRQECAQFLEDMLAVMEAALVEGDTVKLSRFGNFVVRQKRERVGRNPKTGEEVPITPRRVVSFRPSQLLRERVEKAH
ncbi:MAG: integration host factor subunit alpha [Alphaproteobacteria bacterium]